MHSQQAEANFSCFMVEDGERWVGYYRQRENVDKIAATLAAPVITEINPPERIACEDDPKH